MSFKVKEFKSLIGKQYEIECSTKTTAGREAASLIELVTKKLFVHRMNGTSTGYVITNKDNLNKFKLLHAAGFIAVERHKLVHKASGLQFNMSYALQLAEQPDRLAVVIFERKVDAQ